MKRNLLKAGLLFALLSLPATATGQDRSQNSRVPSTSEKNRNGAANDNRNNGSSSSALTDNKSSGAEQKNGNSASRNNQQQNNSRKTNADEVQNDNQRGTNNENSNSAKGEIQPATVNQRLDDLEKKPSIQDELWPMGWVFTPLGIGFIGFLLLLALLVHLLHLFRLGSLSRDIEQLAAVQRGQASNLRAAAPTGKNLAVDKLAEQLSQQGQSLNEFSARMNQIENRFTINDSQIRDAAQAVNLTANWIGEGQLRDAFAADGGNVSEGERAATLALLERYQEPLRLHASRVEPVAEGLADLLARLAGRGSSSAELTARIQGLHQDIAQFEQWHKEVADELTSMRRGSFSQRSAGLKAEQDRLFEQVNNGSLSMAQLVERSRALLAHYFPETPAASPESRQPLSEREATLKKLVADAPDELMNWYDNLFQLQNQIGGSGRSAIETETANDLSRIQQIARDALGKFDIQPEAIQIGQTSYDRRLHEAALVRQAPQFPVNTVIEVHKCGFRKMSTGEVLRVPQVVVAGAAAS